MHYINETARASTYSFTMIKLLKLTSIGKGETFFLFNNILNLGQKLT